MKKWKLAPLIASSIFLGVLFGCSDGSGGETTREFILDGDYTYVDNEILMEMLAGDWRCEEENLQLTIQNDYTMKLRRGSEIILSTEISYAFLQPGEYQDVDISLEQTGVGDSNIEGLYTEMDFDDLDQSRLKMEISEEGSDREITFERVTASEEEAEGSASKESEETTLLEVGLNTLDTTYYDDPIFADTIWTVGTLSEEDADKYPDLQAALEVYGDELSQEMETSLEELIEYGQEKARNLIEEEGNYINVTDQISADLMRADTKVVSFLYEEYREAGGPHPSRTYWGRNYETETGEQVNLRDLVTDTKAFLEVVRAQLESEYSEVMEGFYDLDASFDAIEENLEAGDSDEGQQGGTNLNWLLGYEGITVIFNAEDLGPYAIGAQFVTIYYDEHPELFHTEYTTVPTGYIVPVKDALTMSVDLDGDGTREPLSIEGIESEEAEYAVWYDWEISSGANSITISNYDFSKDAFLIRANAQYYLYLFGYAEGDMGTLNVIDLKDWQYDPEQTMYCELGRCLGGNADFPDEKVTQYSTTRSGIVDPESFIISDRMEMLGTYTGMKTYHVDESGYPATDDDFYEAYTNMAMKTLREVPCEYVDLEGNVIGEGSIQGGAYAVVLRTDNASWLDVVVIPESRIENRGTEDYPYYVITDHPELEEYTDFLRIRTQDTDGYFRAIDGAEEGEVFEGIMYAG